MRQNKAQCFICNPYNKDIHSRIESEILKNEFNKESTWGFRVLERRDDSIHASYVEKIAYLETVEDPFGNKLEYERVLYQNIEFRLNVSSPHIIIFKLPRNFRKLFSQIAQTVNFEISIEGKSIDLNNWIDRIVSDVKGYVCSINIDQIKYDNNTEGKLSLVGSDDVRISMNRLLEGKSYLIKSVKICSADDFGNDIDLFANGKVVFKYPVGYGEFEKLYKSFVEVLSCS